MPAGPDTSPAASRVAALRVAERVVPPSRRRFPGLVRVLSVPVVAALVVAGVWLTGGVVTDDFGTARALTAGWFVLGGLAAVLVGLRWRPLAAPVVGTYVVAAVLVGGYLAVASTQERVVDERVVVAEPSGQPGDGGVGGAVVLARGGFRSGEHETDGVATLVERRDGSRVVTLTEFRTSPGPDLRVYLAPGNGDNVAGGVDLGALKGNQGDQQYQVPDDVASSRAGSVVVWCRAFSVSFGAAALRSA